MCRTIDEGTDGVLPIEALFDTVAFEEIPAGKTKEARMDGGEHAHEIGTVAVCAGIVRSGMKGWRKQRDELQIDRAGSGEGDFEMVRGRGRQIGARAQDARISLPSVVGQRD